MSELHHSQWEFFKRKIEKAPWPIATIQLAEQVLFAHLVKHTFADFDPKKILAEELPLGTPVKVFTASDSTYNSVLIAVSRQTEIDTIAKRIEIVDELGLRVAG